MSSIMECGSDESGELEFNSSSDEFASSSELEDIQPQSEARGKIESYRIVDAQEVTQLQVCMLLHSHCVHDLLRSSGCTV